MTHPCAHMGKEPNTQMCKQCQEKAADVAKSKAAAQVLTIQSLGTHVSQSADARFTMGSVVSLKTGSRAVTLARESARSKVADRPTGERVTPR